MHWKLLASTKLWWRTCVPSTGREDEVKEALQLCGCKPQSMVQGGPCAGLSMPSSC